MKKQQHQELEEYSTRYYIFTHWLVLLQHFVASDSFLSACKHGAEEEAESLLDRSPHVSVDSYHGADGLTALMCASKEGHSKVVSLLQARGAQVDLQDSRGWSALMFACQAGHSQVVWLLLEHGANVDLQSLAWESAHSLALSYGDTNIRTMVEERVGLTLCG